MKVRNQPNQLCPSKSESKSDYQDQLPVMNFHPIWKHMIKINFGSEKVDEFNLELIIYMKFICLKLNDYFPRFEI